MNKVITINLNGIAYQLEESGYEALRTYLENAARRLEGNPDKDEIIADIERAIADKFQALLGAYKTVVVTKEVSAVIAEMGPVQDATADESASATTGTSSAAGPKRSADATEPADRAKTNVRRLYRIYPQGAMLSGVCNGLAAYFNLDPTFFRIAFIVLGLAWGLGILLYVILVLLIPLAETPAEKTAATGAAETANEFIRRAKAGYYEGMKTFHDKQAHREWKRKFKSEMRGWKHGFRREMHDNAHQWQQNWTQSFGAYPRFWVGLGFTWMILFWLKLLCLGLGVYAVYSLVTHGGVFGVMLPAGIPVWAGIIFVIVVYQFLTWPLKLMRYSCRHPGSPPCGFGAGMAGPLDGLVWLGFLALLIWMADRSSPQFHEWLQNLPPMIHHASDSVREWWARR